MPIYLVGLGKYESLPEVAKNFESFGRFVRLNLTGEIVEVLDCNSVEIIINLKGKKLTMAHHQISWATPEEAADAKLISG